MNDELSKQSGMSFTRPALGVIAQGQAVRTSGAAQHMVVATSSLRSDVFHAVALQTLAAGASGAFQAIGPLERSVKNLGNGVACAVGVDPGGHLVRATDPACASGPNWIGSCDASGNITIHPVRKPHFDVTDFGMLGDNDSSNDSRNLTAFNLCKQAARGFDTGFGAKNYASCRIYFPPGVYWFNDTLDFDLGGIVEGQGGGIDTASVLKFRAAVQGGTDYASGYLTRVLPSNLSPAGISGANCQIRDLLIMQDDGGDPLRLTTGLGLGTAATLTDITIERCQGDGIEIGGFGQPNLWSINGHCRFANNRRYGMVVVPQDSNAGCAAGQLDVQGNGSHGIYERSFLGNNYAAAIHTQGNGIYKHSIYLTWYHSEQPLSSATWSSAKKVIRGELILPPVDDRNGYQYRALNAGTLQNGVWGDVAYPTTIGATAIDGDVTVQCWMEEGNPIFTKPDSAHINSFSWIYMELDQNPCSINGDYVHASNIDFELALDSQPRKAQSRGKDLPSQVFTRGKLGADPQFYIQSDLGGAGGTQADPLIAYRFQCDNLAPVDGYSHGWFKDSGEFQLRWFPGLLRWGWGWGASGAWLSYTWTGGRSLPWPGQICWPAVWIGAKGKEHKIASFRATSDFVPDFTDLNGNIDGAALGRYSTGDLIINSGGDGTTPRFPAMWRGKRHGGGKPQRADAWSAGAAVYVGQVVRAAPPTAGDSAFQAQNSGTTGTLPPSFNDTQSAAYFDNGITWLQIGPHGGDFEPLIVQAPTLGTKDCSAGGVIALSEDEACHERIELAGSPVGPFSVVVPAGAGRGWVRVFWNRSGQIAVIKGSAGDGGTAVPAARAYQLLSDGTNTVRVE